MSTSQSAAGEIDIGGEPDIRHVNRELGVIRRLVVSMDEKLDQQSNAVSSVADRVGRIEAQLVPDVPDLAPAPKPPRIPWRLFFTALAASALATAGAFLLMKV